MTPMCGRRQLLVQHRQWATAASGMLLYGQGVTRIIWPQASTSGMETRITLICDTMRRLSEGILSLEVLTLAAWWRSAHQSSSSQPLKREKDGS